MKKIRLLLICTLFECMLFSCDELYPFTVKNNSSYPVLITSQLFDGLEATLNPDHYNHPGSSAQIAFPGEYVNIHSWTPWDVECSRQTSGCIEIYVFDTLTEQDTIQTYFMEEWSVKQTNYQISFPPTEEMRDIKMWPLYGTYDSTGHRIK